VSDAQRGQLLGHTAGIQFSYPEQIRLVFTDVLGAQPVRRAMEVAGEISDGTSVTACGTLGVVTTLEFFEHDLA